MSSALKKASPPSPAGTTMAPPIGLRKVSLKFCMNHAGRRMAWVRPRPAEQVEFDAAHGRLGWRRAGAVGAEKCDGPGRGALGRVRTAPHLCSLGRSDSRTREG